MPEPKPVPVVFPVPVVKPPLKPLVVKASPVKPRPIVTPEPSQIAPIEHVPPRVPPKAIVVREDPVKKKSQVTPGYMKARTPSRIRHYTPITRKLAPQYRGSVMWLKLWPGNYALRGSRIYDFEPLLLLAQRRSYRTGTIWYKVRKNNGRSGWIPAGYLK